LLTKIHIHKGNQAADLDSCVSAIASAFLHQYLANEGERKDVVISDDGREGISRVGGDGEVLHVPLIPIKR